MQIQKLGAYSAQTEKGNTYKTNTWKTSCVLGSVHQRNGICKA